MADPQEFNSLDDLFRKTFDDLPETAAPSGWDTPSPRVWDQVQVRLKPPRSGWSTQTIILVSGLAIAIMLGLYWALSKTETPAVQPTAGRTEQPAAAVTSPQPAAPVSPPETVVANKEDAKPATSGAKAPRHTVRRSASAPVQSTPAVAPPQAANSTERLAEEPGRHRPSGSVPLPGSRPASPNTTVKRQAEQWLGAPWAKPLAPLPNLLESQFIRPVPESLKNLYKPGKQE